MYWIDSHCHLKAFHDKCELENVLNRAFENNVRKLISVGTHFDDWDLYQQLSTHYSNKIYYSVGIHPCYVNEDWLDQAVKVESYWSDKVKPCALGEIGLDYFRLPKDIDKSNRIRALQKECFTYQLHLASRLECPIIIHSRNAFSDCLSIIDENELDWSKVVFHCFSEQTEELNEISSRGGFASFTALSLYDGNHSIRSALKKQGLDRLMLETDSPYLPIEKGSKKMNEPKSIPMIGEAISQLFGVSSNQVRKNSCELTEAFFNL